MSVDDPFRSARLILELRQAGVTNNTVLSAIERTPRVIFVPLEYRDMAYANLKVPIACGQELSLPAMVGRMVQALKVDSNCVVLEVGTGVGYQAAVLSRLARRVFSIERFRTLTDMAKSTLNSLEIRNVEVRLADGLEGWHEASPFDRIILSGAVVQPPQALVDQLKEGGLLVCPVENDDVQSLNLYKKTENFLELVTTLGPSKFLPLISGTAREL